MYDPGWHCYTVSTSSTVSCLPADQVPFSCHHSAAGVTTWEAVTPGLHTAAAHTLLGKGPGHSEQWTICTLVFGEKPHLPGQGKSSKGQSSRGKSSSWKNSCMTAMAAVVSPAKQQQRGKFGGKSSSSSFLSLPSLDHHQR
jgi:hypothetical protein